MPIVMTDYLVPILVVLTLTLATLWTQGHLQPPWYRSSCGAPKRLAKDLQEEIERGVKANTLLADTVNRYRVHGRTFTARTRGALEVHTIEPQNVQAYLATQFEDFGLEPLRKNMQRAFWGRGILNSDGTYWKMSRTMLRPLFSRTEWGNTNLLTPHIDRLMVIITEQNQHRDIVDLEPILRNYTLDTSTEFLFGDAVGAQNEIPPDEGKEFIQAFESMSVQTGQKRETGVSLPWITQMLFGKSSPVEYAGTPSTIIHKFIDRRVRQAVSAKRSLHGEEKPAGQGGARTVALSELAKITDDIPAIRSQLLHMFMPASETTGVLLGSTLYALARAPHVWDDLRRDILEHVSDDYSFEQVKSVPALRHVLQEALRLYPPIVGSKRAALRTTTLPVGGGPSGMLPIHVPKGTVIHTSIFALGRDPDLWGPDAHLFRPQRWATERQDWRFVPFNGGPRICIAQQYVLTEASFVLVGLLKRFKAIEPRDDKPWTEGLKFTMRSKWGVKVKLIPADGDKAGL